MTERGQFDYMYKVVWDRGGARKALPSSGM
jgi:hypothetical protein